MAKSTFVISLIFFSLHLLRPSHARSLSAKEPKTTATATLLLPIPEYSDSSDDIKPKSNDTVPLTRVTFRHIGHIRFPIYRLRCNHGFDRLMPVVQSRLGQRLFADDVVLLHGGFGRGNRGWTKIEGRQPFRVYLRKPSFEVWRNGMKLKKPYMEVVEDDNSQSYNEKVKEDRIEGVLTKIRKFLTQF